MTGEYKTTFHARMKHINICFHFIHKAVTDGVINITYCPTQIMVADILTKPLSHRKMGEHVSSLGLLLP